MKKNQIQEKKIEGTLSKIVDLEAQIDELK
jgi:hypothetical protein